MPRLRHHKRAVKEEWIFNELGDATVVDISKMAFAIYLEAGRHLRSFLAAAPNPANHSITQLSSESAGFPNLVRSKVITFVLSHKIVAALEDKRKDACLSYESKTAAECRSKHSSKWPIRGTERRQNTGCNYSRFQRSFMQESCSQTTAKSKL